MLLLGQHHIKSQLLQAVAFNKVPHAMLFLGATGGAGLALASWFAQVLLCEKIENAPCGICGACLKTTKNIHPDLHFSFPTIGAKAASTSFGAAWRTAMAENPYLSVQNWLDRIREKDTANAQGNITGEECSAILKKLSLKIFEGKYKILLQWRPEFLGEQGNKLLKMIEEPPENTIFLLVAENPDLILSTILSRTQLIKTEPISDEIIRDALISQKHLNAPRAEQIAFLAGGNYGNALELAESEDTNDAQFLLDWLRECYRLQAAESQKLTKRMDDFAQKGRENQKIFLNYALHFMREFMILRETGQTRVRLRANELNTAQNLAKVIDFQRITQIVQLFNDLFYHVERNANPKILFMNASIKLHGILKAN